MSDINALMERTQWDRFFVPPDTRIVDRPELLYTATPSMLPIKRTCGVSAVWTSFGMELRFSIKRSASLAR